MATRRVVASYWLYIAAGKVFKSHLLYFILLEFYFTVSLVSSISGKIAICTLNSNGTDFLQQNSVPVEP